MVGRCVCVRAGGRAGGRPCVRGCMYVHVHVRMRVRVCDGKGEEVMLAGIRSFVCLLDVFAAIMYRGGFTGT